MHPHQRALWWSFAALLAVLGSHVIGVVAAAATADLMRGASAFALAALAYRTEVRGWTLGLTFPPTTIALFLYVAPLLRHLAGSATKPAPPIVRRRTLRAPLALALITWAPWLSIVVVLPLLTLAKFGRWSPELLSQEILSPLVSGFLASTTTFLVVEWIFRTRIVPVVFSDGHLDAGAGRTVGVSARLFVLAFAIAFTPMFTMLGLVAAVDTRVDLGADAGELLSALARSMTATFLAFLALGTLLTLLLARSLTRPLARTARALARIREGDLSARVSIESNDELGVLMQGVNDLASTLGEREHILRTFGRVVEPAVRDRLLAGELAAGGELKTVTILFCDLRGFTALAERTRPEEVVGTLNEFFTVMTTWVRGCGGFVDKFIGDAMLVVFGLFDESDGGTGAGAAAAVRCALGMRDRLDALNRTSAYGGEALALGIGIHTGEVVAGTIGAADRHEYTVIGDTVNVAARLQELCRDQGTAVLVSARTLELAEEAGGPAARGRCIEASLRGRREPVSAFTLG